MDFVLNMMDFVLTMMDFAKITPAGYGYILR